MAVHRTLTATLRHKLGVAVHRVGGVSRVDIRHLRSELQTLEHAVARRFDWTARADAESAARLAGLERLAQIDAVTRFIRYATLRTEPLVSIVLPTCDRPDHLRRAIASVTAQRYKRWELLVVDHGGRHDSREVVDEPADDRIRWTQIGKRGACGARNAALEVASGSLIAYLDDDNLMEPDWLQSIVWVFEQRPDIDVVYGAFVIDDPLRFDGNSSAELPRTLLNPWNREAMRHRDPADIGAIAHRSRLPEARFDERLREMGEWDLLIRLTAERDPLPLPLIACRAGSRNTVSRVGGSLFDTPPVTPAPRPGRHVPCMSLTRRPTVSVVIPCHNYGSSLPPQSAASPHRLRLTSMC